MEIGSNFWIDPNELNKGKTIDVNPDIFGCKGTDHVWLSTGRSAIKYVINSIIERGLTEKRALLPSYTCHTVIKPFVDAGFGVDYYEVDTNLGVNWMQICNQVIKNDISVVLFHNYFGFKTISDSPGIRRLQENGVIFIEDCTQCLYSGFRKSSSDYYIASIRKWLGVPDGGFAVCTKNNFSCKPKYYDKELEEAKVTASISKYRYLFEYEGTKNDVLLKYKLAEDILDRQKTFFQISPISSCIQSHLDIAKMGKRRRDNYCVLLNGVIKHSSIKPLFPQLPDDVVPLYIPVLVSNRSELQKRLVDNSIYAPIIWPRSNYIDIEYPAVEYLYEHLLCIPLDQRYSREDMNRVIKVLEQFK